MPVEQVLGLHIAVIEHERHAGDGEVQRGLRALEVEQLVAPRDLEKAVAQVRLDDAAFVLLAAFFQTGQRGDVDVHRLIAIGFEPAD